MNELQPVRSGSSAVGGHIGLLAGFLLGALVVAIIKPWGSDTSPVPLPASPTPGAAAATSSSRPGAAGFNGLDYDPSIFGLQEPAASWAIWPAGYLVTFGFVIQISGEPEPSGVPPASDAVVDPSSVLPSAGQAARPPTWPAMFEVPEGNHLFLIGINMPSGFAMTSVSLARLGPGGQSSPVTIAQLPSPWPSHFAVLAIPRQSEELRLSVWPPGQYRLELAFDPGAINRSIEIRIAGASVP